MNDAPAGTAGRLRAANVYGGLAIGVAAMSGAAIFIRLADAPALTVAAYRMTIAAAVVGAAALIAPSSRSGLRAVSRRNLALLALGGVFLAAHFAAWISSLSLTSVASSVLLVTTTPVFVAAGSVFVLRERVGRMMIGAVVLSMAGGLVLALGGDLEGRRLLGDALALLGAVAVAGYWMVGRGVRGRVALLPYIAVVYGVAGVLLLALALVSGSAMLGLPGAAYGWMALAALVPQVIGHSLSNWALGHVPATTLTIAVRAEPVIATLLAIPILGEVPPWTVVPGGALLLAGVLAAIKAGPADSTAPRRLRTRRASRRP